MFAKYYALTNDVIQEWVNTRLASRDGGKFFKHLQTKLVRLCFQL